EEFDGLPVFKLWLISLRLNLTSRRLQVLVGHIDRNSSSAPRLRVSDLCHSKTLKRRIPPDHNSEYDRVDAKIGVSQPFSHRLRGGSTSQGADEKNGETL